MDNVTDQDKPKRKPGRPPWTEEQKQARRELNAKKRAAREEAKAEEERLAKKKHEQYLRAKGKLPKLREGRAGSWSPEMKASNAATWAKKRKEKDEHYKQLIAENPHKKKVELGIDAHWKPADGSPSGYYGVRLRQSLVSKDLPPINIDNPHEVEQRIGEYFNFCIKENKPPNLIGMGNWLGVNYQTVQDWKDGIVKQNTVAPVIQRAMAMIEDSLVEQVQSNPKIMVGGMFLLKSMFRYREQSDVNINMGSQNERVLSADEIARRYLGDGKTIEQTFDEDQDGGV